MRWLPAVLLCLAPGCGRVGFDAAADAPGAIDTPDGPTPLCLDDDFNDGDASDWDTQTSWALMPGGPDGTPMLRNMDLEPFGARHPSLVGITSAVIRFDLMIENPSQGDFYVQVLPPGWTAPSEGRRYNAGLYPAGSDNANDVVRRLDDPGSTVFDMTPTVIAAGTWYRIEMTFAADHAMTVTLDGAPHLMSGPDAGHTGPFDIVFDFYGPGAIDNVRVDCAR